MPRYPRYLLAASLAALSTILHSIAIGRQRAWHAPLSKWLCEPNDMPAVPSLAEAITAAHLPLLLVAAASALLLFSMAARQLEGVKAFLWLPPVAVHFTLRMLALFDSDQPWGFCGLHRDPFVLYTLLDFFTFVFVFIYAGFVYLVSLAVRRFLPGSRRGET